MKKKHQKELSFTKERIAILNNNALTKILGGNNSELDTTITSFYSEGPSHTSKAFSDGPRPTDFSDNTETTTLGLSD
ncbi:class I lanthipeptide [uncultured Dokdonia sp.]|uniref:class I lanthipeptide n=1 Tax=uncultured Dokdonia sp. TaxID=575653 RepID=UPI00262695B6|nr:class I lanthipeptide [uncultured Dokdonia sp.]